MDKEKPTVRLESFFGFRTPLLPRTEWQAWSLGIDSAASLGNLERFTLAYDRDCRILRERLRTLLARPEILESLQVASPDLVDSLPRWTLEPCSEKGQRSEMALVRYFARMCHRPTPFGLFAAHGMGRLGTSTQLEVAPREACRRHTRLDMSFLCDLLAAVQKDPCLQETLVWRPNNSIYRMGDCLRYVFVQVEGGLRSHKLIGILPDEPLEAVLLRAKDGALLRDLIEVLLVDGLLPEEVRRYLDELINQQLLVPDLEPPTTGPEPLQAVIRTLSAATSTRPLARTLTRARKGLERLDAKGLGNAPEAYRELTRTLQDLPIQVHHQRLWQVDLFRPSHQVTLGPAMQKEILQALELLEQLTPPGRIDPLGPFRNAFRRRYDQRWVPLAEALDPEGGVGSFGTCGNVTLMAPLLEGLGLEAAEQDHPEGPLFLKREVYLLKRLQEYRREGAETLELTDADVAALTDGQRAEPLPHSFSCLMELSGTSSRGLEDSTYQLLLHSAGGPSAARMLGRFCRRDPGLKAEVERHLREEEQQQPHAIFAEIAHLPQPRMGNVLARPVLRAYEIPIHWSGFAPDLPR